MGTETENPVGLAVAAPVVPTKADEYSPGVKSMSRQIARLGARVGAILAVGGLALAGLEVLLKTGTGNGVIIAGIGAAFFTSGTLGKFLGATVEGRTEVAETNAAAVADKMVAADGGR
jgi:hypothetical protein